MKRTIFLVLAIVFLLAPAVQADMLQEPEDSFFWEHRGECQYLERTYYADGPENVAEVYRSPVSSSVVERVKNGKELWIGYLYEDKNGISWGYCENEQEDWAGWIPMDYLLLKYDAICFAEEFSDRITGASGAVTVSGPVLCLWEYPGSEDVVEVAVEDGEPPEYEQYFTDDAGRNWGYVPYHMGLQNAWICLDAPAADYRTLYAEHGPQQVTHPVRQGPVESVEVKSTGPDMNTILAAVCVIAILSGGFLWITRKKK